MCVYVCGVCNVCVCVCVCVERERERETNVETLHGGTSSFFTIS